MVPHKFLGMHDCQPVFTPMPYDPLHDAVFAASNGTLFYKTHNTYMPLPYVQLSLIALHCGTIGELVAAANQLMPGEQQPTSQNDPTRRP